ncbi:uncharacterized protein LOC123527466 isoform X2 [Mercenaria mercenaria]|uniref:uncharacterized protein LOC123527466 isoform X2 n=1 Tax=Mercenaria mercenaria TaxID=6596 RepID=UPI00234F2338|nr:uncharacterized protein LOC123527466 isoform X2 [Mercenaria mercenaria]
MCFKILLECLMLFHMSILTEALIDPDSGYAILASKIDVINEEMSMLRKALISTQVKLASTQTELGKVKKECGITKGITSAATTVTPTESTVAPTPEETCCQLVETAINEIKQEQQDVRTHLEALIENKVRDLNGEISNTAMDLITTKKGLTQLTEDLLGLFNNHRELKEKVENHASNYKAVIKSEIENADHCQSGNFERYKVFPDTVTVVFKKPFSRKPVFTMGTSGLDFYAGKNLRVHLSVRQLSTTQIQIHINVWANTVAYSVGVWWMACPA